MHHAVQKQVDYNHAKFHKGVSFEAIEKLHRLFPLLVPFLISQSCNLVCVRLKFMHLLYPDAELLPSCLPEALILFFDPAVNGL